MVEIESGESAREDARQRRRVECLSRAEALAKLGSWDWDLQTGEMRFSDEMYRLCGIPQGEPLTLRRFFELIPRDDRRRASRAVREALAGAPFKLEHRLVTRDGELRYLHCDGEVVFDQQRRPWRLLGVALDVTDRQRTTEQREEREKLFRLLVENAHDVIFRYRIRPTHRFDYISPSVTGITGLETGEIYEDPAVFFRRVHREDRASLERGLEHPDGGARFVLRVEHVDRSWRWVELLVAPIRLENGELAAVEGIARDITESKRAEHERETLVEQLDDERRWLDTVIEQLPVAVILIDRQGGKDEVIPNGAAEKLLGRKLRRDGGLEQAAGWVRNSEGTEVPLDRIPIVRALQGERVEPSEYRLRRPSGEEVPVLGSAAPIREPNGRILGAMGVWEDLRSVKDLERLREEWTSIVAHDLRQPVTVITAYGGLLARQLEKPETQAKAHHIINAAKRLNRLIEDLLDVSRIEAHRLSLELQPVDMIRWLEAVIERATPAMDSNRVQLRIESEPPVPVSIDPVRLEQVLGNLLSNAVKYGEAETPIVVTLNSHETWARISVANRGTPIAPEERTRIFGRFHRAPPADGEKISGLGLGLYICKGLVEAHGGRIWAESDPAGINTFRFEVPLRA